MVSRKAPPLRGKSDQTVLKPSAFVGGLNTVLFEGSGRASVCAPPTHDADKLIHRAPVIAVQSNRQQLPCGVRGYIICIHRSGCLFPARSSHGARNTRLTSAAVMPSFLLPPSFLLSPVCVSYSERTSLKVRPSEHGHGFSQPCAAFTPTRAHVMSCLIHDSRLTSAIDLGHTLPPCLKPMLKPY